jgi:hypothetical protein
MEVYKVPGLLNSYHPQIQRGGGGGGVKGLKRMGHKNITKG